MKAYRISIFVFTDSEEIATETTTAIETPLYRLFGPVDQDDRIPYLISMSEVEIPDRVEEFVPALCEDATLLVVPRSRPSYGEKNDEEE